MVQIVKNLLAMQETCVQSLGWEDPLEKGIPTPVFLPREFHGQRSLAGYSPWGHKECDMTEQEEVLRTYKYLEHSQQTASILLCIYSRFCTTEA